MRLSVAALLRGYTVAELGFDPMIIPGWIMTVQPAHEVRQWAGAASPLLTLGTLVDNITDVGFRNVLNNARRDFQVQLPREELLRALEGESPPTLPTLAHLKPAATMMVTPQQDGVSSMTVPPGPPPGGLFAAPPPPVSVIHPQPPAAPLPEASPAAFAPPASLPASGGSMPPQVENAPQSEPASAFLQPPAQAVPPPPGRAAGDAFHSWAVAVRRHSKSISGLFCATFGACRTLRAAANRSSCFAFRAAALAGSRAICPASSGKSGSASGVGRSTCGTRGSACVCRRRHGSAILHASPEPARAGSQGFWQCGTPGCGHDSRRACRPGIRTPDRPCRAARLSRLSRH